MTTLRIRLNTDALRAALASSASFAARLARWRDRLSVPIRHRSYIPMYPRCQAASASAAHEDALDVQRLQRKAALASRAGCNGNRCDVVEYVVTRDQPSDHGVVGG